MGYVELKNPLLTTKYTKVLCESPLERNFSAPHHFLVANSETDETVQIINFQEGPIKEAGINGVMNEDLIAMVIARLEGFQESDFKCKENEMALDKLCEALMWLRRRTTAREQRGVEGTSMA